MRRRCAIVAKHKGERSNLEYQNHIVVSHAARKRANLAAAILSRFNYVRPAAARDVCCGVSQVYFVFVFVFVFAAQARGRGVGERNDDEGARGVGAASHSGMGWSV